eukprot:CAMPEP_0119008232 /NCGR_PEP_ID=MMETSP1176-20130426/3550_1 /TAXON_ID=265551 /ORGANISM="Synedropsis recta cf, Strain CCMP1620" /LENGTH=518 /DNA_ID=CAMNT_0006960525 /DNA_START=100 /DNA_END=1656 /DNA_ORIENTATION=-
MAPPFHALIIALLALATTTTMTTVGAFVVPIPSSLSILPSSSSSSSSSSRPRRITTCSMKSTIGNSDQQVPYLRPPPPPVALECDDDDDGEREYAPSNTGNTGKVFRRRGLQSGSDYSNGAATTTTAPFGYDFHMEKEEVVVHTQQYLYEGGGQPPNNRQQNDVPPPQTTSSSSSTTTTKTFQEWQVSNTWSNSSSSSTSSRWMSRAFRRRNRNPPAAISRDYSAVMRNAVAVPIQGGGKRQTWRFPPAARVQVQLTNDDHLPMQATIDLWQGPDSCPQTISVYIEDGTDRPFNCVMETQLPDDINHNAVAVAIRNTGQMVFPMAAKVEADLVVTTMEAQHHQSTLEQDRNDDDDDDDDDASNKIMPIPANRLLSRTSTPEVLHGGGTVRTYPFAATVASVHVLISSPPETDGRPLTARIELLQGPNNNKQEMEITTEDGNRRPFYAVLETPGTNNVVRVVNTGSTAFPLTVCVEPYMVEPGHVEPVPAAASNGGRKKRWWLEWVWADFLDRRQSLID